MDRLLQLSTFMGHAQPSSTAVYLTITADLLKEANQRFERALPPHRSSRRLCYECPNLSENCCTAFSEDHLKCQKGRA